VEACGKQKRDAELDQVLVDLVRTVARLAIMSAPFIPSKADELWNSLGADRALASVRLGDLTSLTVGGWTVAKPPHFSPSPMRTSQPARTSVTERTPSDLTGSSTRSYVFIPI